MNIALVVLDTLRKDHFDDHFDWLPGTRFENAWSTSHWTVPAHGSLFTGQYGSEIGSYVNAETFDCKGPVLAELLGEAGYTTRAFSGNVNISKPFDFHRGFDQFEGSWRLQAMSENVFDWDQFISETREMGPKRYLLGLEQCIRSDCDTWDSIKRGVLLKSRDLGFGGVVRDDGASKALEYVQDIDFGDNEFIFINLTEAHTPYNPPTEYRTVEPPDLDGLRATLAGGPQNDPARIRQAYADSVRYLSVMYGRIFDALVDDFDLIITLSDHGELLGEHGAWEHLYGIYPELTHVPLSVYSGTDTTEKRTESVSLLDVYRTVLAAAGIERQSRGRDFRTEVDDGEFLTEYHGISDRHHRGLKRQGIDDSNYLQSELSGLVISRYYGHESFNGFEEYGDSPYEDPRDRLYEVVKSLEKREVRDDTDLDDATLEQLEDLGYA